jgi:hypothetical protein
VEFGFPSRNATAQKCQGGFLKLLSTHFRTREIRAWPEIAISQTASNFRSLIDAKINGCSGCERIHIAENSLHRSNQVSADALSIQEGWAYIRESAR